VVVNRGPFLVQEQWLYSSVLQSVSSTRAVAVRYILIHAWYYSSVCIFVDFVPCVLQELWQCGSESSSVLGGRAVGLWLLVVVRAGY
jgi:hypothetical protein